MRFKVLDLLMELLLLLVQLVKHFIMDCGLTMDGKACACKHHLSIWSCF